MQATVAAMITAGFPHEPCPGHATVAWSAVWHAAQWGWPPMTYTLTQAAKATGKSRSTVLRAIRAGRISAARDEQTSGWVIEPSELHRLYDAVAADGGRGPDH